MPNLHEIGSEVQKMAKNVKLQLKASYFRKVREKKYFFFWNFSTLKIFSDKLVKNMANPMERNPPLSNLGKFEQKYL